MYGLQEIIGGKYLEQTSHHNEYEALEAQIRECFGRVVYTHKTHEKMADICHSNQSKIKIWQIVLSAILTCGLVVALVHDNTTSKYITIAISTFLLILSTYTKNFDLGGIAKEHQETATKLWNIRESYLSLLTDINSDNSIDISTARNNRGSLQKQLTIIYGGAPRCSQKAYKSAQNGLQFKEELTFSDKEIDMILPSPLRKNT